jgi:TonB family protein
MKKILVIDYDQSSLQALHKGLTQEGFEVVLASDGQTGWEKFQSEKPDLVLMEAMLSKIHGFELCDRITKDPVHKVPVFIMTGVYKDRVYRTEALRTYGASEYFEKPLDMPKFLASIHGVLTVPDIKPEAEPENGRPADGQEAVPVVKPPAEEPRRTGPPVEARAPREEAPRPKPAPEARAAGGGEINLETVLNIRPAKAAPPKAKAVPEPKAKADDLRLETLLSDIAAVADDHRKPEPAKSGPAVAIAPRDKDLEAKRHEAARKEHEVKDIDQLLKTTLADFGLETEKKKPAKAAHEPAPAPARPKQGAPVVTPPAQKPKPVLSPPSPPAPPIPTPQAAPAPAPPPVAAPAKPKAEPRTEPTAASPKPEPKETSRRPGPQKAAEPRMFKDIYEVEKKKSHAPFLAVGAGLVVVAAVGFFLLRPRHNAMTASQAVNSPATQVQSIVPEKTPDATLPSLPEEKLKAVNARPKPAPQVNRPAEPVPTAEEAIAPPAIVDMSRLNAKTTPEKKPEAKPAGAKPGPANPAETKTAETAAANTQTSTQATGQPPTGTETASSQGSATGGGTDAGAPPAPASKANPGDLVDLTSVDEAPKLVKSFDPVYPAQAARFGKEGSVTVNALISESGAVIETGILKGLKDDLGMEKAAVDAVKKWKFQPAKKDGVNVKVWKPIVITFKANRAKTP